MPYSLSNSRYLVIALLSLLFFGCETSSMKKGAESKKIKSQPEFQLAIAEESQRKLPSVAYINSLSAFRLAVLEQIQPMLDTGITSKMVQGNYDYIEALTTILVTLAGYYSPKNFENQTPQEFISDIIDCRFRWHYTIIEPDGPGTGGTMVRVLVPARVASDIEIMVEDMVFSLVTLGVGLGDDFDFDAWRKSWRNNPSEGVD